MEITKLKQLFYTKGSAINLTKIMDQETSNYLVTKIRMVSSQIVWIMETLFNIYMYSLREEKNITQIKTQTSPV